MRASLEFNLNLTEDREAFRTAQNAACYRELVAYVVDKLRRFTKDHDKLDEALLAVDNLREEIFRRAALLGVDIHDP